MSQPIAFVTDYSSDIGHALADAFQHAGCRAWASTRKEDDIRTLAETDFQAVQLDVNDTAVPARLAEGLEVEAAGLDVLVNNTDYGAMDPLLDGDIDAIRRQFETDVFAVVGVTHAPFLLLRRKSGLVVNVGSVSGVLVTPFAGAYYTSKVAVHAPSDALRLELAPFDVEVLEMQPDAIASNFSTNISREMDSMVDERSPWWPLRRQIQARAAASQNNPTPAEDFTRQLLAAVQRRPCPPLMCIGNGSRTPPALARRLPRGLLERLLKRCFGLDTRL